MEAENGFPSAQSYRQPKTVPLIHENNQTIPSNSHQVDFSSVDLSSQEGVGVGAGRERNKDTTNPD